MRILIAHNFYQQAGGEDAVVAAEAAMLKANNHDVVIYSRHNDEVQQISAVALAIQTLWSKHTTVDLTKLIAQFKPDVIHVHNTLPLISPSLYWVAASAKIPVVQTLHNFRLLCPQAMFLRDGQICEDCLGKVPWRAVIHNCYRESKPQTAVLTSMLTLHKSVGTWRNKVTRYIALNEFCRQKFIEGGLDQDKVRVKPNFIDMPMLANVERKGFLFVGRLSKEKGIATLVEAARELTEMTISVVGTGPEAAQLNNIAGLTVLGSLSSDAVYAQMQASCALVLPSIWYENFPRTLVEAFACGLPVIASRLGAMAELVEDGITGLLFEAANAADLANKMCWAQQNPEKMLEMGKNARKVYEQNYTMEKNYQQLMTIYAEAMNAVKMS